MVDTSARDGAVAALGALYDSLAARQQARGETVRPFEAVMAEAIASEWHPEPGPSMVPCQLAVLTTERVLPELYRSRTQDEWRAAQDRASQGLIDGARGAVVDALAFGAPAVILALLACLSACGGPSEASDTAALDTSGMYLMRIGTLDATLCYGEIDLPHARWYCGHGGYTSTGSASMHGSVTITPSGFVLEGPDRYWTYHCTTAGCDGATLWQPWHELHPPGEHP